MRHMLLSLLAGIVLGGSFGEATADGRVVAGRLEVGFEVEVAGNPTAVAVHVVDPGHDQQTFSLIDRGAGRWGGLVNVEPNNYVIVFEALYADAEESVSDPVTLVELGVDPQVLGITLDPLSGEESPEGLSKVALRWLWAAVALGAAALALLAVWVLGDRGETPPPFAPDREEPAVEGGTPAESVEEGADSPDA